MEIVPNDYMMWQLLSHREIHGRTVQVTEWDAHIYRVPQLMEDGVILVPTVFEYGSAFPVGICECGRCGAFWIPNHQEGMYWDYPQQMIVCEDCLQPDMPIEPIYMVSIHVPITHDSPKVHIQFTQIVDESLENAIAEHLAIVRGLHFFEGRTAADLFTQVLAKRVVRRWRALMQRKLILNMTFVFITRLGMNTLTCIGLARRGVRLVTSS